MGNVDLEVLEVAIAVESARLYNAKTRLASLENDVELIEHTVNSFSDEIESITSLNQ